MIHEYTFVNNLDSSVIASAGVINNTLDIKISVVIISTHILLLLELENLIEEANYNANIIYHKQLQQLIRYKLNDNY
jgi:hypothetical protein